VVWVWPGYRKWHGPEWQEFSGGFFREWFGKGRRAQEQKEEEEALAASKAPRISSSLVYGYIVRLK